MLYAVIIILLIIVAALCIKLFVMKKAAKEISDRFAEKLSDDTNTLIDISSRDKTMCELADNINTQLKALRKEHLQYHQGNSELKKAVTNISHDLRTPLTAISGNLYMIRRTDDINEIKGYISSIEERTEAMKQLTEELFRYSVIVSYEGETQTEQVFVNQLLEESIGGFYPVLSEKGITPHIDLTSERVVRNVNRNDLSRVFSNLLNNAVKYSDGDLDITLSAAGETVFANTAKNLSAVEVEQLFDRFYTVEVARNSTGLGLSIARTLIERMGGTITAEYEGERLIIRIKL